MVNSGQEVSNISRWWASKSLVQQFAWLSSMVVIAGMLVIGSWVANQIEKTVTQNTASSTALYMDSIFAPHLQELSLQKSLSKENERALDRLLQESDLGKTISSVKVWKEGGLIAYSSRKSIIGEVYSPTNSLKQAWSGSIQAEFDSLENEEDAHERAAGIPLLEIYSPIREKGTGRVIAVAEFYAHAQTLKADLFKAKGKTWLVVGFVTVSMIGLLSGLVLRGSRTIEKQSHSLRERVEQLSILRDRIESSSRLSTELNEQFLQRIGSDLHDGPAQLIGLALLRLDSVKDGVENTDATEQDNIEIVRGALNDALTEIRDVSAGLTLPELEMQALEKGLSRIVSMHEQRTNTKVHKEIHKLPENINNSIKISIYRLVQEGLNNAFRHARGEQTRVIASFVDETIEITVLDQGSGFDVANTSGTGSGLGLPGLRERIESIGGSFAVKSRPGQGTKLTARFVVGGSV